MKKNIVYKWWFKLIILVLVFCPIITQIPYNQQNTTNLIGDILQHPYINDIGFGLIIAKVMLLSVFIIPFVLKKNSHKFILGYYILILFIIGLFQNMSNTEYGFSFIIGNMVSQYVIAIFCIYYLFKNKSEISKDKISKKNCGLFH